MAKTLFLKCQISAAPNANDKFERMSLSLSVGYFHFYFKICIGRFHFQRAKNKHILMSGAVET